MNILIVCKGFYPVQSPRSFRSTELAKEFARQGHYVKVITPRIKKIHDEFKSEYGVHIKDLGTIPKEINIPLNGINHWIARGKKRILQILFEYPSIKLYSLVKKALKSEKGYDLLISIAVPHPIHWAVASIWNTKKESRNPARIWVADCGDPFMHATYDNFSKPPWFQYFENKFLRKSSYVSVPFEEMCNLFNSKYSFKMKVIPQGFKFDADPLPSYKPNKVITFVYSGAIIPGYRDPFSLIDYLLEKEYDFRFVLYTKQQYLFKKYAMHLDQKIILKEYISREKLLVVLAQADFLLNINTNMTEGKINAIPTKLIDYRISGRPILTYEQSSLPKCIVNQFMQGNYENQYLDKNFDRYRIENVVKQFLELIPVHE